jgi:phage N-6-adenine-methyltransferase
MPMINPTLTSNKDDWETPPELFNNLNTVFSFDIDVCATAKNTKCQKYYTPEIDGLKQPWHNHKTCWCNPPYPKAKEWLEKAWQEAYKGATTVCLIAARPDTRYWHDIVFLHARAICFLRGRLKFVGAKHSAPFPSALAVFSPYPLKPPHLKTLAGYGQLFVGGLKMECV